jgi:spermidine/putrescine transport system substrate-binding protein
MRQTLKALGLAALIGAAALISAGEAKAAGELKIYNWFDYIPQELLDSFAKRHDVKVTMDTYASNEELLAKLKAGVTGYDIAGPGDYMVAILIKEGLLEKIDANTLPNFKNVRDDMMGLYWDPKREYSIPYQWGTTAFMVDTAVYGGDIDSWKVIFDPPAELKGKINMLKEVNEVLNAGLRYLGLPRCNSNPEDLKKLNELLVGAKANWLSFNSDGAKEVLVTGDAAAGQIYNGFGMRARAERASLKYAYPKEGYTGWSDNMVVIKGAPNLENAKLFMDFMLEPENAAKLTNFARYSAGVKGVEPFLDKELTAAPEVNPPAEPKPEFVPPCDEKVVQFYDKIWTNLLK